MGLVERDGAGHLLDGIEDEAIGALGTAPGDVDVEELTAEAEAARGRGQVHLAQLEGAGPDRGQGMISGGGAARSSTSSAHSVESRPDGPRGSRS